jgi:hypothetical protein
LVEEAVPINIAVQVVVAVVAVVAAVVVAAVAAVAAVVVEVVVVVVTLATPREETELSDVRMVVVLTAASAMMFGRAVLQTRNTPPPCSLVEAVATVATAMAGMVSAALLEIATAKAAEAEVEVKEVGAEAG